MKVWVYPEKAWEELGAVRWEVEWQTVKPHALKRIADAEARGESDEVDYDQDLVWHYRHYSTETAARKAAHAIVNFGKADAFGCATVTKEIVDWYVEEDRIAEWTAIGESIYVP